MNPSLLIASPQLKDAFFERTLVLLWHHDEDGAMGIIINRLADHQLGDVLDDDLDLDLSHCAQSEVYWGGPVEPTSGTLITRAEVPEAEGWNLPGQIGVSRSMGVLIDLIKRKEPLHLHLGYAGWGPGQLDDEILQGTWLYADLDPTIVFELPPEDRYDRALASLGLTPQSVWMTPIDE